MGGTVSVTAGVVTDTALLKATLPKASRTRTWYTEVVEGSRSNKNGRLGADRVAHSGRRAVAEQRVPDLRRVVGRPRPAQADPCRHDLGGRQRRRRRRRRVGRRRVAHRVAVARAVAIGVDDVDVVRIGPVRPQAWVDERGVGRVDPERATRAADEVPPVVRTAGHRVPGHRHAVGGRGRDPQVGGRLRRRAPRRNRRRRR